MKVEDRAARLERVRAALEQAETASGLRPVDWRERSAAVARPQASHSKDHSRVEVQPADATWLAVPDALAPLLPHGAVRRGTSMVVGGSTSLLVQLAAALAVDGAWCALVAHPDLGLAAALDAGLDSARCALVPDPGPTAGEVLGAIVDGFDVVVIGECAALNDRDRRALSQRVRHRGAVLLSALPWPGSEVTLTVTRRSGRGLATHGRLVAEELTVTSTGQGLGAGRTRQVAIASGPDDTRLIAPTPELVRRAG